MVSTPPSPQFPTGTLTFLFTDLDFVLPDGDMAGHVSRSMERGAALSFMRLVGHDPGTYPILATKHSTGTVIATAHFTSTDVWTGTDAGPSA